MGDYYKLKKILLILFIIFTILRIINTSRVFAAEDVNSSILSGDYVVQTDNHYETLVNLCKSWQDKYCTEILYMLHDSNLRDNTIKSVQRFYNYYVDKQVVLYFYTNISGTGFYYQVCPLSSITNANITISGFTWQDCYNFNNIPFLQITRSTSAPQMYFSRNNGLTYTDQTSGTSVIMAIPCLGLLSNLWVEVFKDADLIGNTSEYQSVLADIENNQKLVIQQEQVQSAIQRDTNQVVTNSYNYIKDENIEEITSLGFSSPDVEEKIDLNDVFDQIETLLTNENYVSKQFSIRLPNGDESFFSISPTLLEDNLTRVGGSYIIQIIHAIWFISLYGWYIFAYFGILGKLISGDWFHLVRGQSPITRMVKFSVGSLTGNVRF